jgi:hypothetical protein
MGDGVIFRGQTPHAGIGSPHGGTRLCLPAENQSKEGASLSDKATFSEAVDISS